MRRAPARDSWHTGRATAPRLRGRTTGRRGESRLNPIDVVTAPYHAFNWLTDLVFVTVHHLFELYGTPVVFLAALAETTVGLGFVFPGVVILFLGGAAAAREDGSIALVLAVGTLGTALGDNISYAAGRWWARWLFQTRLGPSLRLGAAMMEGRARWLIPFYHFHSVTRAVGPFGAGAVRLPLRMWMPLDLLGATLANLVWAGGGYVLGYAFLTEKGTLDESPVVRLGLIAIALVWFLLMRGVFQQKLREIRSRDGGFGGHRGHHGSAGPRGSATGVPGGAPDAERAPRPQGPSDSSGSSAAP